MVLIDDDPVIHTLVSDRFADDKTSFAFKVIWFPTLKQGVDVVRRTKPDITLLDLNLEVSGDKTIHQIFSLSLDTAVVVLTSISDPITESRCFNAGAEDYVLKSELKDRCFTRVLKHAWQRHHATERLRSKRAIFELQKLNEETDTEGR